MSERMPRANLIEKMSLGQRKKMDQLTAELQEISGGRSSEEIVASADPNLRRMYLAKLQEIKHYLETFSNEICVENAKNPFQEAFRDGGVEAPEQKTMEWNLVEQSGKDAEIYRDRGLTSWAESLSGLEEKLRNLSVEKRKIIEAEIAEGAIPIIMPGKQVQLETTVEEIKKLRPKFKINEDGEITLAGESYLERDLLKNLIARRNELLVLDIPDEPYILLTKPTHESELRDKTVVEQKQAILDITAERTANNRAPVYAMNLHEYVALQTVFSEMIKQRNTDENLELTQMRPLDFSGQTVTRVILRPLSSYGLVPTGYWNQNDSQLILDYDFVLADPVVGVRLSVRVAL